MYSIWKYYFNSSELFTPVLKVHKIQKMITPKQTFVIKLLCSIDLYELMCVEYLKYASCMKATLTKDSHCGRHYRHLAAQVSGDAGRVAICW